MRRLEHDTFHDASMVGFERGHGARASRRAGLTPLSFSGRFISLLDTLIDGLELATRYAMTLLRLLFAVAFAGQVYL